MNEESVDNVSRTFQEANMPGSPKLTAIRKSDSSEVWIVQASIYQGIGLYREAILGYLKALEIDPNLRLHTILGALFELEDETEQALVEHHQAVRRHPGDAGGHAGLAGLLGRLKREDVARLALAQARVKITENTSLYTLACIEALDGNVDQALMYLLEFLKESPEIGRWAALDPDLCSLRSHPLFDDLIAIS